MVDYIYEFVNDESLEKNYCVVFLNLIEMVWVIYGIVFFCWNVSGDSKVFVVMISIFLNFFFFIWFNKWLYMIVVEYLGLLVLVMIGCFFL